MRKTISMILLVSLWTQMVFAAGVPQKFPTDALQIGKPSSSANKDLIFDTNLGASNPKVRANPASGKFELNKPLDVTGAIGATGAVSAGGAISTTSGDISTANGNLSATGTGSIGGNLTIGTGAAADKSITVNRGGSNPFLKWSETALSWIFSNDGTLEKKLGTGGGGASTGVNVLTNDSFEDFVSGSLLGWSNVGGTLTQETYTNGVENDTKYFQFVATGAGQYFESALITVPTNFNGGGCQVDFKKLNIATNDLFKVEALDSSSNVLAFGNVKKSSWVKLPTLSFSCPAAGATFRVRVTSLAAGTLQGDKAYLGSNQNIVSTHCQGTALCEDTFSARVSSTGVVSQENLDWINGNCSLSGTSISACTYNSNIFTAAPSCTVSIDNNTGGTIIYSYMVNTNSSQVTTKTFTNGAIAAESYFIICQKSGTDFANAKPQTAVSPEQASWFIDANIGGSNPATSSGAISSFSEITDASLDLVINSSKGSASAQISCATGTISSGLTCSSAESIGISFSPLISGRHRACFSMAFVGVSSGVAGVFQLAEVNETTGAIIAEGGERVEFYANAGSPAKVCGNFNFSDTSKRTIKLLYEKETGATITVPADRSALFGQRDIHISVENVTFGQNRPILTGDQVTMPGASKPELLSFRFGATVSTPCTVNGNCAYFYSPTGGVLNMKRNSLGNYNSDFSKNYSYVSCTGSVFGTSEYESIGIGACQNCSTMNYLMGSIGNSRDSYGNVNCIAIP